VSVAKPGVGDHAPGFDLPGSGGRRYALDDFAGTGAVLAFYPGDFTLVCTKQFCSYRDANERVERLSMPLLGVSPQSVATHERFIKEKHLTVPLLADEDKSVAHAYGVLAPGGFVRRAIFVIDGELTVRYRDVKLLGLSFESIEDIEQALASVA
jgi:thioredoxin-dependent peroxiredoxin